MRVVVASLLLSRASVRATVTAIAGLHIGARHRKGSSLTNVRTHKGAETRLSSFLALVLSLFSLETGLSGSLVWAQSRPAQGAAASPLPGGASSLNETYQDWVVSCVQQGPGKRCLISQIQLQPGGQRVLAVELLPPAANVVKGTLALPFGLALDAGVTLQIDDRPAVPPLRFRTCVPVGCLVPVVFDAAMTAAMRTGTTLRLKAIADGGQPAEFAVSLRGFAAAIDRIVALSR
ncbi:MAG: invasion associated locus B family protein [Phreatobacter sp.]|nr:invasion associated locus B family protein [Phreatobacter sp.]